MSGLLERIRNRISAKLNWNRSSHSSRFRFTYFTQFFWSCLFLLIRIKLLRRPGLLCWTEKVSPFDFVLMSLSLLSAIVIYRWLYLRTRKMTFPFMLIHNIFYICIFLVLTLLRTSFCFNWIAVGAIASTWMMMNEGGAPNEGVGIVPPAESSASNTSTRECTPSGRGRPGIAKYCSGARPQGPPPLFFGEL